MKTTLLFLVVAFASLNLQASHLEKVTAYAAFEHACARASFVEEKLIILNNPVKDGQLRIKYAANEGVSFNLSIVNSLGEQVFSAKRNASRQELSFDISKLATGIYFLRVSTEDTSVVKKLIVQ
jgi:hypothetical protein